MTDTEDKRPEWPFETPIETARFVWQHNITRIQHRWAMTGVDTSREWLELIVERPDSKQKELKCTLADVRAIGGKGYGSEIVFAPDHAGLLRLDTPLIDRLKQIDAFEKKHKRERAEYERLRKLFGTT